VSTRLQDKVAIITGGASGIGRASVLRFLEHGARVVFADVNAANAEQTAALAAQLAPRDRLRYVRCDVSQDAEVAALVQRALAEFGRLDCIFNNAGIVGAVGPLAGVSVEDWDRTFAVLVRGVFLGIKHAAAALQERGGTIINNASIAGLNAGAGPMAYSACKAAVISMTRSAAVELAPARIRVNALCPGLILTPLTDRGHTNSVEGVLESAQPWPEAGKPEDIADAAVFLASDEARFMTGESIVIDGGLTARGPNVFGKEQPVGKAIAKTVSRALIDRRGSGEKAISFDPGNSE
jgi:NAD(P)-dependent dehydrogenase (short-subunit alcohol dehydrogenase family)